MPVKIRRCVDCALGFDFSPTLWAIQSELQYSEGHMPLNELISHCAQEEERLKREKTESVHLTTSSQNEKEKDCRKFFSKREGRGTTKGVNMFHL